MLPDGEARTSTSLSRKVELLSLASAKLKKVYELVSVFPLSAHLFETVNIWF